MTDHTPSNESLPPLGAVAPAASTPPPPPPPRPPVAAAEAASQTTVEPTPSADKASSPRRSLALVAFAVLAVGGIAVGVLVGTGGDDSSDADGSAAAAPLASSDATSAPAVTAAPTTSAAPATTAAPTTTAALTTTEAPTTTVAGPSYPTLPDGSPEPIIAIYDGPVVRASGWVPSQAKAEQLEALALANSTDPNATVEANWSIDPAVPLSIGTRVIEMNSPRFPAGSADVTPEHAAQLDRVANVMNLLPNLTVTVVGHADQLGDEQANYALSEARAVSVVRYLVSKGVAPSRLSSRAVGEQDLLSADESEASLALNRRTEFIFYGLLAD